MNAGRHVWTSSPARSESVAGRLRTRLLLLSPFGVIAAGQLTARIIGPSAGNLAWVYLFIGYWIALAVLLIFGGGQESISRWLQPSRAGHGWPLTAILFSFATTLWIFIPNWQLLLPPGLLFASLVFALVNACLEEGYWRGLIIDVAERWPGWLAVLYAGGLSAINHLFLTVVVPSARNPAVWAYQLIVGLLMGIVYLRTNSLRWPIISHAVINMLSLPVAMFLNIYIPGLPG